SRPSLLSWLILGHQFPGEDLPIVESCIHSGSAPDHFSQEPLFKKYVRAYLPRFHDDLATSIDRRLPTFRRQWEYESRMVAHPSRRPSDDDLDFWFRGQRGEGPYTAADLYFSEVYRSAYLRTLAWAVSAGLMLPGEALSIAAKVSPVNVDLWRLNPSSEPAWWPSVEESSVGLDTAAPKIWTQIEQLWSIESTSSSEWRIAESTGIVRVGKATYNLEIFGAFQRFLGGAEPDIESIVRSFEEMGTMSAKFRWPLEFEGSIDGTEVADLSEGFGGWEVVPAVGPVQPMTSLRWQFWRYRGFWLPQPFLAGGHIQFAVGAQGLRAFSGNKVIAQWADWVNGLSEKRTEDLPMPGGQFLRVRRTYIEKFASANRATFCWVCRLSGASGGDR